jgi:hypothetical protein
LLLAVIWAVVLVPPWLQSRREASRPTASIANFRRQLSSLARTSPRYGSLPYDVHDPYGDAGYTGEYNPMDDTGEMDGIGVPGEPDAAPAPVPPLRRRRGRSYRRRRTIAAILTVITLGAVSPAVLLGGAWWTAQGVTGGLLVLYLALLVRRRHRLAEQAQKVRYLTPIRAPRPAVVVLGSSAAR